MTRVLNLAAAILAVSGVVVSMPADADYTEPAVTGFFDAASGEFGGIIRQFGCITGSDNQISGHIKDGRLIGYRRGVGEGNFDIPIEADGSFGPAQYFLRTHSSGDEKFYWLSGKVFDNKIVIDVEYGSPGHGDSYCGSNGNTFEAGADCPMCGIELQNPDSAQGLDIDSAARDLINEWGEYAAMEAATKAIYSEEAGDMDSKATWLKVRARIEELQKP